MQYATAPLTQIIHTALGVNFGLTYITAAYMTKSNDSVPVVKIEGSQQYQTHMKRLVDDSQKRVMHLGEVYIEDGPDLTPAPKEYLGYDEPEQAMFSDYLRQVTDHATRSLGYSIEITAAGVPSGLDGIATRHLYHALINTDASALQYGWQRLQFLDTARLAYHLDTCQSLGLASSCNINHKSHTIFYVDYNAHYLDLWMADVTEMTLNEFVHHRAPHHKKVGDSGFGLADETMIQAIRKFVSEQLAPEEAQVRAVIVSGDTSSLDSIRDAVKDALPARLKSLLRDHIDPMFLGAFGAAHRARKYVHEPELLDDSHDHDHFRHLPHDEL
ncbi:hypothetical protein NUU61_009914 [Penicillium alfredii]|uniref:Uncharacterized protein n=1 Tax=Penicillium alfredii TaxID=1506179 RepID=A0A9W9EH60_9EURO|nr:uncharacterized protein NUU61_009914 [Penicillium alfredii]KAJ5081650.1 hypothetical protein NUU61_009914 [Penicillium alfredii]